MLAPSPKKKTTLRRFLEFIRVYERTTSTTTGDCSTGGTPSTSTSGTSSAEEKAASKAAAKKAAAEAKASKAADKAAKASAAAASAEAAKRKVGPVSNKPTKAVKCTNASGALTEIPLASIEKAIEIAQEGPLVAGKNAQKFPHTFNNIVPKSSPPKQEVKIASVCNGHTLEEQAVGVSMTGYKNIPSVLTTSEFNQFRVIITTPDKTTGATTFCGVMTHGTLTTGAFLEDLCEEA
ncbi:hypothetical protein HMN09_00152700 [Mycena chlorophos]|uniref:Uncharacterized protein n=1 Tax=Mycena chlorophos TaxID=658473 RepID=A0A8H6TNX5_MYCCL|nr:hypothetical protein HMN09_00152700 [Mycena chlorophos]